MADNLDKAAALIKSVMDKAIADGLTNEDLVAALSYTLAGLLGSLVVNVKPGESRDAMRAYVAGVLGMIKRETARIEVSAGLN